MLLPRSRAATFPNRSQSLSSLVAIQNLLSHAKTMRSIFWPNPALSTHPVAEVRDSRKLSSHNPVFFKYFAGSVTPGRS